MVEVIKVDMDILIYIDMLYSLFGKIWLEEVVFVDLGRLDIWLSFLRMVISVIMWIIDEEYFY